MKKAIITLLSLITVLTLFVSCEGATVSEEIFKAALTDALSNVTLQVEYQDENRAYVRTVKCVDGKVYMKNDDGAWRETTDDANVLVIISAISKHYDKFAFADGAYSANDLHLVDDEGHYTDITNVKMTFDSSGNATSISFDEVDEYGSAGRYTLKLSSHGSTTAPTEFSNGNTDGSGSLDNSFGNNSDHFGPSYEYNPSQKEENIFKPDNNVDDGGGNYIPDDSFTGDFGQIDPDYEDNVIGFETDAKKWKSSFSLMHSNYSATFTQYNGSYENKIYYRVVDGKTYSSYDGKVWQSDIIDTLQANLAPFADLFDSYTYEGSSYHCERFDFEGVNIGDSRAEFDGAGRLRRFDFSVFGEECYTVMFTFDDFGKTEAPTVENKDGFTYDEKYN